MRKVLLVTMAAGALALAAPAGPAVADPGNAHASCMGIEASAVSPPGSSDEEPGGMPQFVGEIKSFASPPGAGFATFAHLHEGSHEACDEAVGG